MIKTDSPNCPECSGQMRADLRTLVFKHDTFDVACKCDNCGLKATQTFLYQFAKTDYEESDETKG